MSKQYTRRSVLAAGLATLATPFVKASDTSLRNTNTKGLTILFQGDSITDGNRGRDYDPNHILGHGYAFSIASEIGAKYPDRHLKFVNRGISGNKISDLSARWNTDALDLAPDVLSILAGINDVHAYISDDKNFHLKVFEDEYRNLLQKTRAALPETLLVIGEPFILPVGMVNNNIERWTSIVHDVQQIVRHLAKEFDAIFIPYQELFSQASKKIPADYWIWDGIHPTYSGHGLMKNLWLEKVSRHKSLRW